MCTTVTRLRNVARSLALAEGNIRAPFMASDAFIDARAAARLLSAAAELEPEIAPIVAALIRAVQTHPSDYATIARAYDEAESACYDLAHSYRDAEMSRDEDDAA